MLMAAYNAERAARDSHGWAMNQARTPPDNVGIQAFCDALWEQATDAEEVDHVWCMATWASS